MPPASDRPFSPGFRLSIFDVAVLALGGVVAWVVGRTDGCAGVAVAFDVGHFFLFCNVVRMGRRSEMVWATVFVVGTAAAGGFGVVTWPAMFGGMILLTIVLVALEVRRPSYHGVDWWWVNPGLPAWWAAHGEAGYRSESHGEAATTHVRPVVLLAAGDWPIGGQGAAVPAARHPAHPVGTAAQARPGGGVLRADRRAAGRRRGVSGLGAGLGRAVASTIEVSCSIRTISETHSTTWTNRYRL